MADMVTEKGVVVVKANIASTKKIMVSIAVMVNTVMDTKVVANAVMVNTVMDTKVVANAVMVNTVMDTKVVANAVMVNTVMDMKVVVSVVMVSMVLKGMENNVVVDAVAEVKAKVAS